MKKTTTVFFLLFLSLMAAAQSNKQGELHFNHLFVKDGMTGGRVTSIVQDKQGFMWIGTQKGLVRYDGYSPKVYNFGFDDPDKEDISIIYLDREGRLWAGGYGVLFLYDRGEDRFIQYKLNLSAPDSSSLKILDILEDYYGNLWLNTSSFIKKKYSLERFDLTTKKFLQYDKDEKGTHHINANQFTSYFEDKEDGMWVGSDNGIYQYNEKSDQFDPYLPNTDSTKQNTFYFSSVVPQPGILWMTVYESKALNKGEGLWRYDTKTKTATVFRHRAGDSTSIASDNIYWSITDSLRHLWITTDSSLSLFDSAKNNFINYRLKDNNTGKFISMIEIQQGKNGNLWLSTGQGLVFFNTKTRQFTRYTAHEKDPYGLVIDWVRNLFIDHSGTLWFGVGDIGIEWINKQLSRFIQYKDDPGQPNNFPGGFVNSFAEAKDSTIWLGSEHGLYHWDPLTDSFTLVKIEKNQEKDVYVATVMVDKEGLVWCEGASSLRQGLYCYDPKTGKTRFFSNNKKDSTSLSDNYVTSLLEDHLGNIWVGTNSGGICRFNRQSQNFTRYPYIKNNGFITQNHGALDNESVLSIYEDKNGTLWVGTNGGGGLNRFNRQTGTFTTYLNQLPGFQCILSIYGDDKNKIWAGTYLGGVFSLDPQTNVVKKYTEKNGLLYDGAFGIVEDVHGNLWLSSERGISIFNPQTKQVRNITTANGLPSQNIKWAFKTRSGRFLFSSIEGFISLNPDNFTPDPHPPIVHIESVDFVTSNGRKPKDSTLITWGKDSINLKYNENRLSFHYVALYYQNSQLNQYAYKLAGYDKDWVPAGTQRMATYTNLSPGHYTFHVKAANSDGVWNEQGDSFSFTILPPWWQTWWAYTLYILAFLLAVWAFASYRSRNLRRANLVLEDKVEHRTAQLHKSIEDLKSTQSQLIQSEKMASLGELTAGIAHEIQNPLNFVNNFSDVNKELLIEMKDEMNKGNIDDANAIANDVIENEEKINHHGKRAGDIVKGMLQHSRTSTGVKEPTDINKLADEYLRLSYHGLRAKDKGFNAEMKTDFDESIGKINIIPQDIGRVLLNLFNNAFYALNEKQMLTKDLPGFENLAGLAAYEPTVSVSTKKADNHVIITVSDNGNGIPQNIVDKIFQPFFTTKPTGSGTGLGLSLSYDIVKAHGGEIKVESKEGEGTQFIIQLPTK
ncbi:MAG TPA: two-component regulator propeller domain-containing protein [Hanamia sp.]